MIHRLVLFAVFLPVVALAQDVVPLSTPANSSMADTLRYLALTLLLPILAAAAKFAAQAIQSWAESKGNKWVAANAKVTALLADAVAYVDAQTQAERIKILEDGKVSAEEAAQLQAHALAAAKQFLGANGLRLITDALGVAAPALDDWLKGRLQGVFAAKMNAEVASGVAAAAAPSPQLAPA